MNPPTGTVSPSQTSPILEGIFAIDKPPHISSAEVLLRLQHHFAHADIFAPLLSETRRKRAEQEAHQPPGQKRKDEEAHGRFFKMGHGGTLDPLAQGVLIVGIGRGTRFLREYLGGVKTYETVVLFGKATDTYDVDGCVVEDAPFEHVTRELVETQLEKFRGKFRQKPPLYSSIKIDGQKAHEYARRGEAPARELESREVTVDECSSLEWLDGSKNEFHWPGIQTEKPCPAPAARIRLTVSSGFYVRSFAHDLGHACGSAGLMASLVRARQGSFTIHTQEQPDSLDLISVIEYDDIEAGKSEVWEPQMREQLTKWMYTLPVSVNTHVNGRDPASRRMVDSNADRPRQRFRGEWMAESKQDRIKQQGGRFKGKWSRANIDDAGKSWMR